MPVALSIFVGLLAILVALAAWRLGATNRGLILLATATVLGVAGLIEAVEEYDLVAIAISVLLVSGPLVLWKRAERAVGTLSINLRPSSHEITVDGPNQLLVTVHNNGPRNCAPLRLECPDDEWRLSRPGFRLRPSEVEVQHSRATHPPRWRRQFVKGSRVPALGPGEHAELNFLVPSSNRGVLTLPNLKLWCIDPFELFAYEMALSTETSILVVPNPSPPTSSVRGVLQPAGRIEWSPPVSGESTGGQGFDLSGLRAYVPGDRLRLLHWPTLARTGELLVRDFEGSGTDAVTLIMDDRAGFVDRRGFEKVVSAAAGIGLEAARLGLGLELRTPGGVNLDIQAGSALSKSILRVLATLDPIESRTGRLPSTSFAVAQNHDSLPDKHRIVVSTAQALETLPELLRRTSTVVVV